MARPRKQDTGTNLSDTGTSSVANRKQAEKERQAQAREERARLVKETKAAQKATQEFLESKPTDSRKIADTRNVGG
jgi:ElaB/YqjD/DUF883 family membrane-anchored ribosome-binding protein